MNPIRIKTALCLLPLVLFCALEAKSQELEKGLSDIAAELSAAMASSSIKKLAVIDFSDLGGSQSVLGQFIAEELVTDLIRSSPGRFDIVERRQLAKVLSEQKLSAGALFDPASIASVGKILGIQAIVTGSFADLGEDVKINARVIAVDTAKIFTASSTKVKKAGTVERLLYQGAAVDASASAGDSRQSQPSDVFFQNQVLRVDVKSATISKDKSSMSLALVFRNLTGTDLHLALYTDEWRCYSYATGSSGDSFSIGLSGFPCISSDRDRNIDMAEASHYVAIPSGGQTTILGSSSRSQLQGNLFSINSGMVYMQSGKWTRFVMGLSNIQFR
jgi:curli biogenesis system outer membrane secretion channel CsgG